jgi:hypothetical protein
MKMTHGGIWYHGSPLQLTVLRAGSTVTQWKELAEAFSHKPPLLSIGDDLSILHTGTQPGYLYRIAELVAPGTDFYEHPRSTMGPNMEFLTTRPLRLERIAVLPAPDPDQIARTAAYFDRLRAQLHP